MYTGNPAETQIVNAETGEPVEGVTEVNVIANANGVSAFLHMSDFQLDLNNVDGIEVLDGDRDYARDA